MLLTVLVLTASGPTREQCIEKDMSVLRLQMEILSNFSYSDPAVLLQELSAAVAFAEASPEKQKDLRSSSDVPQRNPPHFHASPVMVSGHDLGSLRSGSDSD